MGLVELGPTVLVVPDAHAEPGVPNDRFDWIGRFIRAERPEYVVCLGDLYDLQSAGKYDKGKVAAEGLRIHRCLQAGNDALERIWRAVRRMKRRPEMHFAIGNHEDRLDRIASDNPEFEGTVGSWMLPLERYGWERHGFLEPFDVEGVWFSHYFTKGVMAKPISGVNPARTAVLHLMRSVVWGHSHEFHYSGLTSSIDGATIHALNAGCYFTHNHAWAGPANNLYRRGLTILRNVRNGDFDFEFLGLEQLEARFA